MGGFVYWCVAVKGMHLEAVGYLSADELCSFGISLPKS